MSRYLSDHLFSKIMRLNEEQGYDELSVMLEGYSREFPNDPRIFYLGGICFSKLQQPENAIRWFRKSIELSPEFTLAINDLAVLLKKSGLFLEAKSLYERLLHIDRSDHVAASNLANLLNDMGKYTEAEHWARVAIVGRNDFSPAHNNLGLILKNRRRFKESEASFKTANELDSSLIDPLYNLGLLRHEMGKYEEALNAYDSALEKDPGNHLILSRKLYLHALRCDFEQIKKYTPLLSEIGTKNEAVPPFGLLYLEDRPDRHLERSRKYWSKLSVDSSAAKIPAIKPCREKDVIHLGYFSSDFHAHAVTYLIAKMVRCHDRKKFTVSAFSLHAKKEDEITHRLQESFDEYNDWSLLTDLEIVERSRAKGVDIAIDLSGYTRNSRPKLFKLGVAPIQINFLGYPGSMGTKDYQYIVADKNLITPALSRYYDEKIIYMPNCYLVSDDTRERPLRDAIRNKFKLTSYDTVFCAFNNVAKFSAREISVWSKILTQVDNAQIWLTTNSNEVESNLRGQFKKHGINDQAVKVFPYRNYDSYLETLSACDVFLDSFNFNAGATANDALWCEVPLVTLIGQGYTARMAASQLSALSLSELIAPSEADYIAIVKRLAEDSEFMSSVKRKLADDAKRAALFSTSRYTQDLESSFIEAYGKLANGHPAHDIII